MKLSWSLLASTFVSRLWVCETLLQGELQLLPRLLVHDVWMLLPLLLWERLRRRDSTVSCEPTRVGQVETLAQWLLWGTLLASIVLTTLFICRLGTPLTLPMLRAADGTLFDSVAPYLDSRSLAMVSTVVLTALAVLGFWRLPAATRSATSHTTKPLYATLALLLLWGSAPCSESLRGLQRNSWSALLSSTWQHWRGMETTELSAEKRGGDHDPPAAWRSRMARYVERALPTGADLTLHSSNYRESLRPFVVQFASGYNVVLVVLESVAATHLERHPESMPFLTELAAQGWGFDCAYTTYPESIKGLTAILDSRYPAMHSAAEDYAETGESVGIVASLRRQGYRTALFHSGRFEYLGMESVIHGRGFDRLFDAGDIGGLQQSSFGVDEESTVDALLRWIRESDLETHDIESGELAAPDPDDPPPFFACYMPIAGHHPYDSPNVGPYFSPRDGDNDYVAYLNAIHYCDQGLRRLWQGISPALRARTLWVVVGDHGQAFEEHPGNSGHVFDVYEENVRIPLVMACAGVTQPRRSHRVVSAVDIGPTLLALLRVDALGDYEGEDLLQPGTGSSIFFCDYSRPRLGVRSGPWKYIVDGDGAAELFELPRDPGERHNQLGNFPEIDESMRQLLQGWRDRTRRLRLTSHRSDAGNGGR